MRKYKVRCRIDGEVTSRTIECREMTIERNSYCFWTGEYGVTNTLLFAFPIMFTIVEGLLEDNKE